MYYSITVFSTAPIFVLKSYFFSSPFLKDIFADEAACVMSLDKELSHGISSNPFRQLKVTMSFKLLRALTLYIDIARTVHLNILHAHDLCKQCLFISLNSWSLLHKNMKTYKVTKICLEPGTQAMLWFRAWHPGEALV